MKARMFILLVIAAGALILTGTHAAADSGARAFRTTLDGYHETPLSISTAGYGTFQARLNPAGDELLYELRYADLEGGNILFSHVHIGQTGTTGGVMFFLCGGGGKPACPAIPATVTGSVNASNIMGPSGQGVSAGEFQEALRAMRTGAAYVNVHTGTYTSGEIRGQISTEEDQR